FPRGNNMVLTKRTYVLPAKTLGSFEQLVPPGQRSATVALLLQEWLDRSRREKLRREIIEGCKNMADVYLEVEKEYHPLEEEVHRVMENSPKARRRRPRKA